MFAGGIGRGVLPAVGWDRLPGKPISFEGQDKTSLGGSSRNDSGGVSGTTEVVPFQNPAGHWRHESIRAISKQIRVSSAGCEVVPLLQRPIRGFAGGVGAGRLPRWVGRSCGKIEGASERRGSFSQRLKPGVLWLNLLARLKSCPWYKARIQMFAGGVDTETVAGCGLGQAAGKTNFFRGAR
jgi:hypothetical protein